MPLIMFYELIIHIYVDIIVYLFLYLVAIYIYHLFVFLLKQKPSILEIYGKVLKALRYLSDGTIEYKTASDFIGDKKGQTQTQTAAIFKNCQGKVLLIDEAYNLDDDSYGAKAIDTIVEQIDPKSGADMAVIMAGYEKEMMKMLRDQNPGLSSRFDPARALFFRDFDNKALGRLVLLFLHGGLTFYS